jgi:pimeloyl-ACP methyl ester carboxylesterase
MRYAEQGNPNGDPIILIHGFTDSQFSYSRIMPLLDKKYRVFAIDQRGHGDSDKPEAGYSMKDFASDVISFMDAKDIKKATIVGHSMGSFVALQTALDAPQRVERLALIGTATTAGNAVTLDLQKEISLFADQIPEKFIRDFQVGTSSQSVPDKFINQVVRESMKLPARVWRSSLAGLVVEDYKSRLGKINAPTLIVWGEKENIFPREEQHLLKTLIRNSVLKTYSETGHSPHWEHPEKFARDLQEFLHRLKS